MAWSINAISGTGGTVTGLLALGGGDTYTPSGNTILEDGVVVTTATPSDGYEFDYWVGDNGTIMADGSNLKTLSSYVMAVFKQGTIYVEFKTATEDGFKVVRPKVSQKAIQDGNGAVIADTYATQTALSGKQDALTTAQQDAVDSGITSTKVSTYDGYQTQINNKQVAGRYAQGIKVTMDASTYVITVRLEDQLGDNLATQTVDLPLESVVVSGSYDATNKKVVLTLKSGSTVEFSVADLVSGLQTELSSTNQLPVTYVSGLADVATSGKASDLIEDATHRLVTDTEKTTWNDKINSTSASTASGTAGHRKITISTSTPSGGSDGDIWFVYTA